MHTRNHKTADEEKGEVGGEEREVFEKRLEVGSNPKAQPVYIMPLASRQRGALGMPSGAPPGHTDDMIPILPTSAF
jgi:hypothetical protein